MTFAEKGMGPVIIMLNKENKYYMITLIHVCKNKCFLNLNFKNKNEYHFTAIVKLLQRYFLRLLLWQMSKKISTVARSTYILQDSLFYSYNQYK